MLHSCQIFIPCFRRNCAIVFRMFQQKLLSTWSPKQKYKNRKYPIATILWILHNFTNMLLKTSQLYYCFKFCLKRYKMHQNVPFWGIKLRNFLDPTPCGVVGRGHPPHTQFPSTPSASRRRCLRHLGLDAFGISICPSLRNPKYVRHCVRRSSDRHKLTFSQTAKRSITQFITPHDSLRTSFRMTKLGKTSMWSTFKSATFTAWR